MLTCKNCSSAVKPSGKLYCSNQCQLENQYRAYVASWKQGKSRGDRGVRTKNISKHIRKYLFEKFHKSCSLCGWSEVNAFTGNVPLEVDHIDGNSENNLESNLRLICPNCHSLTNSFRNLNKGKGREWRRARYIKSL